MKELYYNGQPLASNGHKKLADVPVEVLLVAREELIAAQHDPQLITHGEVLSPSQANGFVDCSARWYFRYALELPEASNAKQALGKAVHKAAEHNYRQKLTTHQDLPDGEVVTAFRAAWEEQVGSTLFHGAESPVAFGKKGEALVSMYMAQAAPTIQPAQIEQVVRGEIAGVKVCGIVDLIDINGKVIDLKTGASKPPGVPSNHRFQISTYQQVTPGVSGEARIDYVIKTKVPKLITLDFSVNDDDRKLTETLYPLVQAGIRSGLYWPNRKSLFCSRKACGFWEMCEREYGGRVNGEIEVDV